VRQKVDEFGQPVGDMERDLQIGFWLLRRDWRGS